jgi:hypothetical protein
MNTKFIRSALAVGLLTATSVAVARPAVIVTGEPAGKNMVLALDFVADNQPVTAVMVEIKLKQGAAKSALNLSGCMKALASTHTGGCNLKDNGNLAFLVYGASDNVPLKSGPIGTVTLPRALLESADGKLVIPFVEFTLPSSQTIAGDAISEVPGLEKGPGEQAK